MIEYIIMYQGHPPRNACGFSLVETITVVAIIGVLSAIMVPAITSITRPTRVFAEAQTLLSSIQQARQLALTYNSPVRVAFFEDEKSSGADKPIRAYALLRFVQGDTPGLSRWVVHTRRKQIDDSVAISTDSPLLQLTRSTDPIYPSSDQQSPSMASSAYALIEFLPTGEATGQASDLVLALGPAAQAPPGPTMNAATSVLVSIAPITGRAMLLRSR